MHLLLLEDDLDLAAALSGHLLAAGHEVCCCASLGQAQAAPPPDMALIDLALPDGDGLALLRDWRQQGRDWPVIVLTARDQVSDRILGLQAGADDYLVKPFDLDEMLARIDAVARRSLGETAAGDRALVLDADARIARLGDEPLDFTQMEWAVLSCLSRWPGRIFSRSEIESHLHAQGLAESNSNSLEVIVSRLRKKLGNKRISTHRRLGYRLEA